MKERCDPDVFKNGHSICLIDACSHRAEEWVQSVARVSGQRVGALVHGAMVKAQLNGSWLIVLFGGQNCSERRHDCPLCGGCSGIRSQRWRRHE